MRSIQHAGVAAKFASYPPKVRGKLLRLRGLLYRVAAATPGVGEIEETLKWGEPAYLTKSGSGSTLRMDWKKKDPEHYALYFNCQTNLVERFRAMFPHGLRFEGNRAVLLAVEDPLPADPLAVCIAAALTYHQRARRGTPLTRSK